MGEAPSATPPSDTPSEDRLDSWKEIAVYLDRDVTTVQRWEKREGMPVHRHLHDRMGSVYASRAELDEWVRRRSIRAAQEGGDNVSAPIPVAQPQGAAISVRRSRWRSALPLAVALVLAVVIGAIWLAHKQSSKQLASTTAGIRSLVVLPLDNYSGNHDQDYLSDGMTEALIARLSTIQGLRVISRTSAMQLKGTHKSVPTIGKELNVDAVIEGSVLRAGDKIRVTVQLIRTDTDAHLWAGTYDRELQDVLALQSEVTYGIAGHVEAAVSGLPSNSLVGSRAVAPEVYENYLKGRYALNKDNRAGIDDALRYFKAAVAADPKFAPAYAGIADAYDALGTIYIGGRPDESRPQTLAAARKALELDPNLTEAHLALAAVLQRDWHWEEAEREYKRAIELSPSNAGAHAGLAGWLLCQGLADEALVQIRRAQELDPLAFDTAQVGWIYFSTRRYNEAIREYRTVLTLTPDEPATLWYLGFALCGAEQFDEAIRELEKAAALTDRSPGVLGVLVRAYAGGGRRTEALRVLDELKARRQKGYVPAAAFLNAYLGLGDREEAFVWLGHAAEERSDILQFLKVHPFFDPLRSDPRFAEYLRRANLAP